MLALTALEKSKLQGIIVLAKGLMAATPKHVARKKKSGKRVRRTGKELVRFRKMLKAERAKGIPVIELARKHRVSSAYIYTLP